MKTMTVSARVSADGVLRVTMPMGIDEADKEVQVTIAPVERQSTMTQGEYASWVQAMAGSWQGNFERPPQGPVQEREPL